MPRSLPACGPTREGVGKRAQGGMVDRSARAAQPGRQGRPRRAIKWAVPIAVALGAAVCADREDPSRDSLPRIVDPARRDRRSGAGRCFGSCNVRVQDGARACSEIPTRRFSADSRCHTTAGLVLSVAALTAMALETMRLWPDRPFGADLPVRHVAAEQTGQALAASAFFGVLSISVGDFSRRHPQTVGHELFLITSGLALMPLPLTGYHASAPFHGLIMLSREAYALVASAWVGALFALALLVYGRRKDLAVALPRFSTVATAALAAVRITGVIGRVGTAVGGSGFGAIHSLERSVRTHVLAMFAILSMLAAIGGHIRTRMMQAVAQGRSVSLLTWTLAALALMGAAFGLAAALSGTPPGTGP